MVIMNIEHMVRPAPGSFRSRVDEVELNATAAVSLSGPGEAHSWLGATAAEGFLGILLYQGLHCHTVTVAPYSTISLSHCNSGSL